MNEADKHIPLPPPQKGQRGLHSQSLDLMRFPLAVVVLTVHVSLTEHVSSHSLNLQTNFFKDICEVFLHNQSVPIYYFIAGYVFFFGMEMKPAQYARKLRNRVKSLLIPYLIWNLIAILIVAGKSLVRGGEGFYPTAANLLSCFWMYDGQLEGRPVTAPVYPIDLPLWFVRDLMIVVVLTPLLYWAMRHLRHFWVWMLGIVWLLRWQAADPHAPQLITAFFFFSWGGYMSIYKKDMIKEFGRMRTASFIVYPLLGVFCWICASWQPEWFNHLKDLYVLTGLCAAYNFSALLLTHKVLKVSTFLSSASFFIYVSHFLIVAPCMKIVFGLMQPQNVFTITVSYLLSIAFITGLLLAAFWLMQRYTPSVLRVAAGRR